LFGAQGEKVSSLDLTGHGLFTILTGIGGDGWISAAKALSKEFAVPITVHKIGARQIWQDLTGDWARAREISDSGALLVRPDHHVAWRSHAAASEPEAELRRVLKTILDR
jgi:2,4-dichlorophenol 6-monooxygenase